MCKRSPFLTYFSETNNCGYTWQPDCDGWGCVECRPRLEKAWNEHAAAVFQTCSSGIGYLCVRSDRILAMMKRLARAGSQYIRVRGHGIFHIYVANKDLGQKTLSVQQAIDLFAEHVAIAPSGQGHVISTSRGWRRHQDNSHEPSDLRCIATRVGPDAIRAILDRLDQPHSQFGQAMSFRIDSTETAAAFLAAVQVERANCPYCPSDTKRRRGISDSGQLASTGTHRLPVNPAFEALRSP